jgi:Zn finger protein HypA/HybF involved in hydrogenase expression
MGEMFNAKGKLNIPLEGTISIPKSKIQKKAGELVVNEAYCPKGHSLMSEVKIDNESGIHFIYTNKTGKRETDIVISPVVRKCRKKILKGEGFSKNEIVKILCPRCRTELDVLFDCECGAPIYLFYINKQRNYYYGQSFCSRIGCVKASQLRFSQDMLQEFIIKHVF